MVVIHLLISWHYDSAKAVSSGFIGALFAGFVGGYIMVLLRKLFDKLPSALEGLKPILLFPVCGIFNYGCCDDRS